MEMNHSRQKRKATFSREERCWVSGAGEPISEDMVAEAVAVVVVLVVVSRRSDVVERRAQVCWTMCSCQCLHRQGQRVCLARPVLLC